MLIRATTVYSILLLCDVCQCVSVSTLDRHVSVVILNSINAFTKASCFGENNKCVILM